MDLNWPDLMKDYSCIHHKTPQWHVVQHPAPTVFCLGPQLCCGVPTVIGGKFYSEETVMILKIMLHVRRHQGW